MEIKLSKLLKAWLDKTEKVYIVLEHHTDTLDEHIHGVYNTREAAEKKASRERYSRSNVHRGYISVLEFKVKGY